MTVADHDGDAADIRAALAQRLQAIGPVLLQPATSDTATSGYRRRARDVERFDTAALDSALVLDALVHSVHADPQPSDIWLLLTAIAGVYPDAGFVEDAVRFFELNSAIECEIWLLDEVAIRPTSPQARSRRLTVVRDTVVADVNQAARDNHHTGIQQVIRQTLPRWHQVHDVLPVAWAEHDEVFRELAGLEVERVLHWHGNPGREDEEADLSATAVVPWNCVIAVMDIPTPTALDRLAAMGRYSGNRIVAVGYDAIPVINAPIVPVGAADRTARYLSAMKFSRRIAGISVSAAMEFQGFSNTLTSQGVPPPIVVECQLPDEPPTRQDAATGDTASTRDTVGRPLVLSVGSLEPRKNHLALLHAAETLWREGLDFELQLIGGSVWGDELQDRIAELKDVGRPLTVSLRVSEAELAACYGRARFSVFASLHEGYGLPVAESLAAGVPAITSGFGSMAEIASAGGALTVNPRDDRDLTAALRRMISDDALIAQLKDEITRRPQRSWNDYAAELWDAMVAPELANDTA